MVGRVELELDGIALSCQSDIRLKSVATLAQSVSFLHRSAYIHTFPTAMVCVMGRLDVEVADAASVEVAGSAVVGESVPAVRLS